MAAHAERGVKCLDCHEAELSTQIAELKAQLSGDYRIPLAKMQTDDQFCMRCHTREDIVDEASDYEYKSIKVNPHAQLVDRAAGLRENPHTENGDYVPCASCHSMHRTTEELYACWDCHHAKTVQACGECHED